MFHVKTNIKLHSNIDLFLAEDSQGRICLGLDHEKRQFKTLKEAQEALIAFKGQVSLGLEVVETHSASI